jgi:tetratricopeptide (TPR) repeat protein
MRVRKPCVELARRFRPLPLLLLLLASRLALAGCDCVGGLDSLQAERNGAPGVYEALLGLYGQHLPEYYQARAKRLRAEAAGGWTARLYDDLAFAEAKLGRPAEAAALMRTKAQTYPSATTDANLGRYLALAGDLPGAEEALARASGALFAAEWQLRAVRYLRAAQARPRDPRVSLLGFDLADHLGPDFRRTAPPSGLEAGPRASAEAALWDKLGLPETALDGIISAWSVFPPDHPEPSYALAELLAAKGYRRLAWHAYQRAIDLGHPRAELLAWQQQVLEGLPSGEARDHTPARHYSLRRTALGWVAAWQAFERKLLADGGNPDDPLAVDAFYQEHPRP